MKIRNIVLACATILVIFILIIATKPKKPTVQPLQRDTLYIVHVNTDTVFLIKHIVKPTVRYRVDTLFLVIGDSMNSQFTETLALNKRAFIERAIYQETGGQLIVLVGSVGGDVVTAYQFGEVYPPYEIYVDENKMPVCISSQPITKKPRVQIGVFIGAGINPLEVEKNRNLRTWYPTGMLEVQYGRIVGRAGLKGKTVAIEAGIKFK
jgi:hypothetical protein